MKSVASLVHEYVIDKAEVYSSGLPEVHETVNIIKHNWTPRKLLLYCIKLLEIPFWTPNSASFTSFPVKIENHWFYPCIQNSSTSTILCLLQYTFHILMLFLLLVSSCHSLCTDYISINKCGYVSQASLYLHDFGIFTEWMRFLCIS